MSEKPTIRCIATGDSMITRPLPAEGDYEGFGEVRDFISQGDFRFTNLETTVHNYESFGSAQSGGSWLCSPPSVLDSIKKFGFNIVSTANNHALDYSYGGLYKTLDYLKAAELPFSGTGETMAEAAAPTYVDTPNCRYAMIACTMSFNPGDMAGEQTRSLPGRPGVNGIRVSRKYQLPANYLTQLDEIARQLHLNDKDDIIRKEGYLPQLQPGEQPFGAMMFEAADKAGVALTMNETDVQRILSAIKEARFMADYVIVSFHNHEISGAKKETVDPVSIEFAHRCVDAGADAIIGTGPHLLRPMEIYNGKPVFYCLGDFINQLETFFRAPADMFAKQKLSGNCWLDELFEARSDHGKRGLCYQQVMFEAVIPYWEVQDGKLQQLVLMPVEEQFNLPRSRNGLPRHKADSGILERFAEMSAEFGVEIEIRNGLGYVKL